MRIYTLQTEQWIPRPLDEVFRFFADAKNLEQITPPWLRFHVVDPPGQIRRGTLIDYRLRIRGVPVRWQSEITEWEPPYRFVDVQRKGPYRLWIHEHQFEPRDGGTLVRDNVQYAARGGLLVAKLFIAPDLNRIFGFRKSRLQSIFGGKQ